MNSSVSADVQQRRAVALQGEQLKQRVEAHELQAGPPKDLGLAAPGRRPSP